MQFRLRTLLIVLAVGPMVLAMLWVGLIQPVGSATIGLYEAQQRSDAEERQP
jgi:signal transduction histidine kinase